MRLLAFLACRRIVLALALLFFAVPVRAGDGPTERASLKGITSIQVLIEPIRPDAERDGLTTTQLEADVELRLRQAGIRVVPLANDFLQVHVLTVKNPDGRFYAYNVSVVFYQVVVPMRHVKEQTSLLAATWSVALLGVIPTGNLRDVRSHAADQVNNFINAYLEQNPRP